MNKLAAFLSAVPGSAAGVINLRELKRAVLASGVLAVLTQAGLSAVAAVQSDAPNIFQGPYAASIAACLLGLVADLVRRLGHESPAAPGS